MSIVGRNPARFVHLRLGHADHRRRLAVRGVRTQRRGDDEAKFFRVSCAIVERQDRVGTEVDRQRIVLWRRQLRGLPVGRKLREFSLRILRAYRTGEGEHRQQRCGGQPRSYQFQTSTLASPGGSNSSYMRGQTPGIVQGVARAAAVAVTPPPWDRWFSRTACPPLPPPAGPDSARRRARCRSAGGYRRRP